MRVLRPPARGVVPLPALVPSPVRSTTSVLALRYVVMRLMCHEPDLYDLVRGFVGKTLLSDPDVHAVHRDLYQYTRDHMNRPE